MSAREQYRRERSPKVGQPIEPCRAPEDDLPSLFDFIGGLAFMVALAAGLWLLPFVADALRGVQ